MGELFGNGVECYDCGFTGKSNDNECPRDPDHAFIRVQIDACPAGVTVADWQHHDSERMALCDSDNHEWRSGNHITREGE